MEWKPLFQPDDMQIIYVNDGKDKYNQKYINCNKYINLLVRWIGNTLHLFGDLNKRFPPYVCISGSPLLLNIIFILLIVFANGILCSYICS